MEHLSAFLGHFPFVLMVGKDIKLNFPRLVEAALIVIVTAVANTYVTQQILAVQMTEIRVQMLEMKQSIEQMRRDLYVPRGK